MLGKPIRQWHRQEWEKIARTLAAEIEELEFRLYVFNSARTGIALGRSFDPVLAPLDANKRKAGAPRKWDHDLLDMLVRLADEHKTEWARNGSRPPTDAEFVREFCAAIASETNQPAAKVRKQREGGLRNALSRHRNRLSKRAEF